jgi:hypothetical protein
MSQYTEEKPKAKGFKPFAVIFIGLIVILVIAKFIIDALM